MKHIAAYMMLKAAGKSGSAAEITAVVAAAGGEADADAIAKLLADVEGKDINEIYAAGMEKVKDVYIGGGGGGGGGGGDAGGAAPAEAAVEKVEEEEMDMSGGIDMFGGEEGGGGGGDY